MQQFSDEQGALLGEEIGENELRELLDRLSATDLGGSEQPTIGAVVEATGTDPRIVASILAEIRKESFEKRFDKTFGDHERRITAVERSVSSGRTLSDEAVESRQVVEAGPAKALFIFIMCILLLISVLTMFWSLQFPGYGFTPSEGASIASEYNVDGVWVQYWTDDRWSVRDSDGEYREPSEEELEDARRKRSGP